MLVLIWCFCVHSSFFFLMNCHFWQQLPKFIKTNQWKACLCSYPHVFKFFYLFLTAAIIQIYKNWINEKSACVQMLCLCSILFLELSFLTAIIIIQIYKKNKPMKRVFVFISPCVRNELSFLTAVTCIIIPCVQNESSFLTAITCIITQIYKNRNQWKACLCSYAHVFSFLNQYMTCHFWQQQLSRFMKTEIMKRVLVFMWCACLNIFFWIGIFDSKAFLI